MEKSNLSLSPLKKPTVFAGGVAGIETLMDACSSTSFRFNGGGIYIHGIGWAELTTNQRKAIILANCGAPVVVEIGFGFGELHDKAWAERFLNRYMSIGLAPAFVTCNAFAKGNVPSPRRWQSFVQDFKDYHYPLYPIFEYANYPAHKSTLKDNTVTKRADFQQIIEISGGMAVDTAGRYFLNQGVDYKNWIVDVIQWTKSNGFYAITYASPHGAQTYYKETTVSYLDYLAAKDAMPDAIIVGNYKDPEPIGYVPVVGREWIEDTGLGVGHFLVNEYFRSV